jgi:hypothetical protein
VVVVDALRPMYNYITCDYSTSLGFVYAHVAIKCGLLMFGVALTWLARNTPSQFNESSFIGICIYNVSIVICFIVPILSADLGGRESVYLIRAFVIMFITVTTVLVLYIPKLVNIYLLRVGVVQKHRLAPDVAMVSVHDNSTSPIDRSAFAHSHVVSRAHVYDADMQSHRSMLDSRVSTAPMTQLPSLAPVVELQEASVGSQRDDSLAQPHRISTPTDPNVVTLDRMRLSGVNGDPPIAHRPFTLPAIVHSRIEPAPSADPVLRDLHTNTGTVQQV